MDTASGNQFSCHVRARAWDIDLPSGFWCKADRSEAYYIPSDASSRQLLCSGFHKMLTISNVFHLIGSTRDSPAIEPYELLSLHVPSIKVVGQSRSLHW